MSRRESKMSHSEQRGELQLRDFHVVDEEENDKKIKVVNRPSKDKIVSMSQNRIENDEIQIESSKQQQPDQKHEDSMQILASNDPSLEQNSEMIPPFEPKPQSGQQLTINQDGEQQTQIGSIESNPEETKENHDQTQELPDISQEKEKPQDENGINPDVDFNQQKELNKSIQTAPSQSNDSLVRFKKVEQENLELQAKRDARYIAWEKAKEEETKRQQQLQKERLDNLRHSRNISSLKAIEETKLSQQQRNENKKKTDQTFKQVMQKPKFFEVLQEKFDKEQELDLAERKKILAKLREISKPMDFDEIKVHQDKYESDLKKMAKFEIPVYKKSSNKLYQSSIYEKYSEEYPSQEKQMLDRKKRAAESIERKLNFSQIVSEKHMPKPSKLITGLAEDNNNNNNNNNQTELSTQTPDSKLNSAFHRRKNYAIEFDNSKRSLRTNKSLSSKNSNQNSSVKNNSSVNKGGIFEDNSGMMAQLFGIDSNKERAERIGIRDLQEEEKQRQREFAKMVSIRNLGQQNMKASKEIIASKNVETFVKESLIPNAGDIQDRKAKNFFVDSALNVLKTFDTKVQQDRQLLKYKNSDYQARQDLTDKYLISINSKLAVITALQSSPSELKSMMNMTKSTISLGKSTVSPKKKRDLSNQNYIDNSAHQIQQTVA